MFNKSLLYLLAGILRSQTWSFGQDKFAQMYFELPTPNSYHTASGSPGTDYWQQRADYQIKVRLDDENQRIYGEEVVTYHNNSPDPLNYLWLQLDQNIWEKESDYRKIKTQAMTDHPTLESIASVHPDFDGGYKLSYVKDTQGKDLKYSVNKTMMRIDLPSVLLPGQDYSFQIKYWYNININNTKVVRGRTGYEPFI